MNSTDQEREAFARENRYIVIKRSDLIAADKEGRVSHEIFDSLEALAGIVPRREYVVIESDWPEYEPAWSMIEARMTGQQPAGVAVPDGWRLVPIEPTQEMHDAGRSALVAGNVPMAKVYRAMLSAAPHPVSGEQKADELHRLDKQCRDDVARAMGMSPVGDGYPWSGLLAGIKIMAAKPETMDTSDIESMVAMLENREWAEHVGVSPLGQRLEAAITDLINRQQGVASLERAIGLYLAVTSDRSSSKIAISAHRVAMSEALSAHRAQRGDQKS